MVPQPHLALDVGPVYAGRLGGLVVRKGWIDASAREGWWEMDLGHDVGQEKGFDVVGIEVLGPGILKGLVGGGEEGDTTQIA